MPNNDVRISDWSLTASAGMTVRLVFTSATALSSLAVYTGGTVSDVDDLTGATAYTGTLSGGNLTATVDVVVPTASTPLRLVVNGVVQTVGKLHPRSSGIATPDNTITLTPGEFEFDLTILGVVMASEAMQDLVGAMFSGNTETGISATYDDSDGTIDLVAEVTQAELDAEASTRAAADTALDGRLDTIEAISIATDAELAAAISAHEAAADPHTGYLKEADASGTYPALAEDETITGAWEFSANVEMRSDPAGVGGSAVENQLTGWRADVDFPVWYFNNGGHFYTAMSIVVSGHLSGAPSGYDRTIQMPAPTSMISGWSDLAAGAPVMVARGNSAGSKGFWSLSSNGYRRWGVDSETGNIEWAGDGTTGGAAAVVAQANQGAVDLTLGRLAAGVLGTGSGHTFRTGGGAVGAPGYSFVSNPTDGIYNPSAGTVNIATAGVQRVTISSAGVTFASKITAGSGVELGDVGLGSRRGVKFGDATLYRDDQGQVASAQKISTTAGLGVGNSAAGSTPGTVVKKVQIFDMAGASLGYLAVYDAIT